MDERASRPLAQLGAVHPHAVCAAVFERCAVRAEREASVKSADVRIRYLEGELGLKPPMNLLPEGMNSNI